MKKTFLAIAVAGVATIGMMNVAQAADGTINFNGEIIDQTCTVAPDSVTKAVNLGKVAASALTGTVGTKASPTRFTLKLTNCPATATAATIKFDGTRDADSADLLQLTQVTGAATGVGIEIADKNGTPIPLHTASSAYTLKTGDNDLDFVARYVSTKAAVTVGPANSVSQFTLNYQ